VILSEFEDFSLCDMVSVLSFGLLGALKSGMICKRNAMYVRDTKNSNRWMQFCAY